VLFPSVAATKELVARRGESFGRISWQEANRILSGDDEAGVDDGSATDPRASALASSSSRGAAPTENRLERGSVTAPVGSHAPLGRSSSASAARSSSSSSAGMGAASGPCIVTVSAEAEGARASDASVLFLDVRPQEDFAACRLREAVSCPATLARQDRWPRELMAYKYKEERGLVLYDSRDDGEAGTIAARLISTGQYPNVVVLTGGMAGALAAALTQPSSGRVLGTTPSGAAAAARVPASASAFLANLRGHSVADFALGIAAAHLPAHMQTYAKRVLLESGLLEGGAAAAGGEDGRAGGVSARSGTAGSASYAGTVRGGGGIPGAGSAPASPSSMAPASSLSPFAPRAAASRAGEAGGGSVAGYSSYHDGGAAGPAAASAMGPSSLLRGTGSAAAAGTFGSSSRFAGPIGGVSGGVAMGAKGAYHYS